MKPIVLLWYVIPFFCWNAHGQAPHEKIGYADVDYIFNQLPVAKQIESELKSLQAQLDNQLKNKYEELSKKYSSYVEQKKTANTADLQSKEKELQVLQENFQKFEQDCQATLQRKQKQLLDPVTQSIQKAISAVANESGYDFILNAGAGRNDVLLFAVERSDVSDLVLQKMGVQTPAASPR